MALTVDEFLEKIGSFERYQWMLLGMFGYILIWTWTFPIMIVIFLTAEPAWMCVKGYNSSVCNFTEYIGLINNNYEARCNMPRAAWTYVDGFTSVVTEYDLVCDKSYLLVVVQSCSWVGMFIGLFVGGYAGDRFGRKTIFYLSVVGVVLGSWVMVFPKHVAFFVACRTFIGMTSGVVGVLSFVMLCEYSSEVHRAKIGIHLFNFWVAGLIILAIVGYFLPNWRNFLLANAVMASVGVSFWWLIPESTRWLLLQDKHDDAKKQLAKVARINKKELPDEELIKPVLEKQGNFRHLFFNWETTKRSLINWDLWMSVSLVYYGVSYSSVDLGWNPYLTFALTGLIEFPSNLVAIWTAERFGRKKCTVFSLILACVASIVAVMIPYEQSAKVSINTIFRIIMAIFSKFFITIAYSCVYVWTVELFPTFIRSMALSFATAASIVGSICATYVIWLIRIHTMLPFGIMAFFCLQSSIVTMFLPETNGQATLEVMLDMKAISNRSKKEDFTTTTSAADGDAQEMLL